MEKEICRRQLSREGIGCVWVFMNMFDFRHGGSNQKLLIDKKRGSKRITGIETNKVVKQQLTCDCDSEENEGGRQSVKKLIEDEIEEKSDFECRGVMTKAKNRKRRSKTLSKTSEDVNVLIASDDDDHGEKSDDSEEKFSELIKRLIAQKERETESLKNHVDDAVQDLDCEEGSSPNIDESTWGDSQRFKESSPCAQTIVILKPEPNGSSSPGTHKAKNGRFGSRFMLRRISRRLKSAVGKNPCNAQHDSDQDLDALSSDMSQNSCLGEDIKTSPEHDDVSLKSEANKEDSINGSEDMKKKSVCGIYIAAKKHLSEMFAEGDIDVDLPDKETPRILGKILALPEFSTPESSPRMTSAYDFVGHQVNEKPKIQQCSSEDYSETLGSESNKDEKEEKNVLDSVSEANSSSIIREDGYVDEDEHQKVETLDEEQSPSSPPNSSTRMSECQENATDVLGKSSPVSVLEPFFTDDETSPSSSKFSSVERRLQPLCIRFEEPDSPRTDKDNDVETTMDDKELALAYIQSVVKSSDLNWEELLVRSFYSDQVLEQALMDDIDFCSTKLCADKNLLFDCINEVVMEFCRQGPWLSFVKPEVLFFPDMDNAVEVVQEEVYWHLLPLPSPHTLDQIVRKDFARKGSWMDLRFAIGCIGFEASEIILDELLEEVINNCTELFFEDETS